MGYTVQISGHLLGEEEVREHLYDSSRDHEVISDAAAKTIASWWHSSGSVGRVLSQLSHGLEFDTEALSFDTELSLREADVQQDRLELQALQSWADHWTGDYRC
jgi:hypothetical protein